MTLHGDWNGSGHKVTVEVENGRIVDVDTTKAVPPDAILAPGFFDMQVNGYGGVDYSSPDLTSKHMATLTSRLFKAGVTRHVPTIVTNSRERIRTNLGTISKAVSENEKLRRAIPAVHVEGPYISEEDGPRGAHDAQYVRNPDIDELWEWNEAADGLLRMVTIAPERPGAVEFIEKAAEAGFIVALGHTGAPPETIRGAVQAGARMSTHLGNGSHGTIPRLRNYLWEQLAADELSASIIADGFHLPPSVMKVFARAKGLERLILVSDVGPMGGLEPGRHQWGNIEVDVYKDGHLGLANTEFLAGAGHLLDRAVAQFVKATGVSLQQALQLCTLNPGQVLGIDSESKNSNLPSINAPANFVQFELQNGADIIDVQAVVNGSETWVK